MPDRRRLGEILVDAGVIGLFEALPVSRQLRELIAARATSPMLASAAQKSGLRTLRDDGISKALIGATTLDEVARVTSALEDEVGEVNARGPVSYTLSRTDAALAR